MTVLLYQPHSLWNDIIKIKDYGDTTGSFIPPTPTKLGMYPKFKPELVTDNTYRTSKSVIVGHDGSRTLLTVTIVMTYY
jgi:hypothetical protein